MSSTALWLVLELGQQQCTENVNQMQIYLFMQQCRLETAFDKNCWGFRAKRGIEQLQNHGMCDVLKQTNVETKSETSVVSYTRGEVRAGPENKLRVLGACKCHVTSELSKCFTLFC